MSTPTMRALSRAAMAMALAMGLAMALTTARAAQAGEPSGPSPPASAAPAAAAVPAAEVAQPVPAPFSFDSAPGRLPKNVVPLDYRVSIVPDASALTLRGTESVRLQFRSPSATVVFNSLNETLRDVRLDGKPVASVATDDAQQLTTVSLPAPACPAVRMGCCCRRRWSPPMPGVCCRAGTSRRFARASS